MSTRREPTAMSNYGDTNFIQRMQEDQNQRAETGQINELKKEAKGVPAREARRINKMVNNYEKQKGIGKRGASSAEAPKPTVEAPKMVCHDKSKIREKNKYLDQWGPLGW